MRIATWNINSVRLRIDTVIQFLKDQQPDILCLQETKCPDELFPSLPFIEAGYKHLHFHGMKSYNGVAIISKHPLQNPQNRNCLGKEDCRHSWATIDLNGVPTELHCLYVPAGGPDPDPVGNPKFKHKLDFVDDLTDWFGKTYNANQNVIALGDLNIAPLEHDVWSHKQLLKEVSHTPIEVEKFTTFYKSLDWVDAMRHFVPANEKLYSWWSYRNRDWKKSNRGRRLDHIWVTPPLQNHLQSLTVLKEARDWDKPSDHVPVIIDFKRTG